MISELFNIRVGGTTNLSNAIWLYCNELILNDDVQQESSNDHRPEKNILHFPFFNGESILNLFQARGELIYEFKD